LRGVGHGRWVRLDLAIVLRLGLAT
jgi:hypothetical protein